MSAPSKKTVAARANTATKKSALPKAKAQAKAPSRSSVAKAKARPSSPRPPSQLIDGRIAELGDWRGDTLAKLRSLIKQVEPAVVEEWKWRGVPVWYSEGMLCTGESYKNYIKITFAKGAALDDPAGLFNSSLEGNTRRAIDFHEGEKINEKAFKALVRGAVALNKSNTKKR